MIILENYLEDGGGVFSDKQSNKFVYFSENPQDFQKVYEAFSQNQTEAICFEYTVPMVCNLFGAKIKLGDCKIVVTNLIPYDLDELKNQANTFISGDSRRLAMTIIINHQQIALWSLEREENNPNIKYEPEQIKHKAICFEIEPQKMTFGNTLFIPDEKVVKKKNIILKDTLSQMIEIYRPLWEKK